MTHTGRNINQMDFNSYQNKHAGERCFILGSAPSLAEENLSLLDTEKVFVCNRGYRALDIGLNHFDYYVISDQIQYEGYQSDIQQRVSCPRFYASYISECETYTSGIQEPHIQIKKTTLVKHQIRTNNKFPKSFQEGWGKTSTVVLDASLVAYFMGFSEIYLLGCDWHYKKEANYFYKHTGRVVPIRDNVGLKYLPDNVARFREFFKSNDVKFINLSKGFKDKHLMDSGDFEEVINGKGN